MFKKVVASSFLATNVVEKVFFDPGSFGACDLLLAVYGYALQIYCDFSAYTDISIGVAALLGYRFPENFDQPYRSIGFRDFWRRWHISLSSWLRDYLYIPLGGNTGDWRRYKNLMITMLLGGLWHGAAWNFAIWGGLHGGLLVIEHRLLGERWTESATLWVKVLGTFITFQLVCFTWIFFRAVDLPNAITFIGGFSRVSASSALATPFTLIMITLLLASQFLPAGRMVTLERYAIKLPPILQGAATGVLMIAIFSIGPAGIAPFIYFQF
jgi:D-alanyl-lipoteichoic acid acyltransferase DltB (MBOAT superfamily)